VVSGSGDRTVRVWDAATGKEVQKLEGHSDVVTSVAFSPVGGVAFAQGVVSVLGVVMGGGMCGVGCLGGCERGAVYVRVVVVQVWFVCGWGDESTRVLVMCARVCCLVVRLYGGAGHVRVRVSSVLLCACWV
jgi:hypothetical protein